MNGFENGMLEIKRGLKQDIYIDPVRYSFSLDSLVSMSSLQFRFYCSVIDEGLVKSAPFVAVDKKIDLMTFKKDKNYGNFLTCFNTTGKFTFFIILNFIKMHSEQNSKNFFSKNQKPFKN